MSDSESDGELTDGCVCRIALTLQSYCGPYSSCGVSCCCCCWGWCRWRRWWWWWWWWGGGERKRSGSDIDGSKRPRDCESPVDESFTSVVSWTTSASFQLRCRRRLHASAAPTSPGPDEPLPTDADRCRRTADRHMSLAACERSSPASRDRQCDAATCCWRRRTSAVVKSTLTLRRECSERRMRLHSDSLQAVAGPVVPPPPLYGASSDRWRRRSSTSQLSVRHTRHASSTTVHAIRSRYDVMRPSSATTVGGRPIGDVTILAVTWSLFTSSSSSSSSSPAMRRWRLWMADVGGRSALAHDTRNCTSHKIASHTSKPSLRVTRGRTDYFSTNNSTSTVNTWHCYLFTVSNSGLLFIRPCLLYAS